MSTNFTYGKIVDIFLFINIAILTDTFDSMNKKFAIQ